jgi:hypothetical protein
VPLNHFDEPEHFINPPLLNPLINLAIAQWQNSKHPAQIIQFENT